MSGKKTRNSRIIYAPGSLINQIERWMNELNTGTQVEAMNEIAKRLERTVIRRKNKIK